jgi:hypothetical protein
VTQGPYFHKGNQGAEIIGLFMGKVLVYSQGKAKANSYSASDCACHVGLTQVSSCV